MIVCPMVGGWTVLWLCRCCYFPKSQPRLPWPPEMTQHTASLQNSDIPSINAGLSNSPKNHTQRMPRAKVYECADIAHWHTINLKGEKYPHIVTSMRRGTLSILLTFVFLALGKVWDLVASTLSNEGTNERTNECNTILVKRMGFRIKHRSCYL